MPFSTVRSSGSSYSNKKHQILQCWAFSHCVNYSLPHHCFILLRPISLFQCCTKGFYNREACITLGMERVSILTILYLLMEFDAIIRCLRHLSQCSKNFSWVRTLVTLYVQPPFSLTPNRNALSTAHRIQTSIQQHITS